MEKKYFRRIGRRLITTIGVFSLISVIFIDTFAKEPNWLIKLRSLQLFKSKKTEVEKTFDKLKVIDQQTTSTKTKSWSYWVEYKTKEGFLDVTYSNGKCNETNSKIGYNIEKNTLVDIEFTPFRAPLLETLGTDLRSLKSITVDDMPNVLEYYSEELGIEMSVKNNKLTSISFSSTQKPEQFNCNNY